MLLQTLSESWNIYSPDKLKYETTEIWSLCFDVWAGIPLQSLEIITKKNTIREALWRKITGVDIEHTGQIYWQFAFSENCSLYSVQEPLYIWLRKTLRQWSTMETQKILLWTVYFSLLGLSEEWTSHIADRFLSDLNPV